MSNIIVKVVDIDHPLDPVLLTDETQTGLGILIFQCEQLLTELKDAEAAIDD